MAPFIIIFLILLLPSIGCRSKTLKQHSFITFDTFFCFLRCDISSRKKIEFSFCKWNKKSDFFSGQKNRFVFFFNYQFKKTTTTTILHLIYAEIVCVCVYEHGKNLRKQQRFSVYLSFFLLSWMSANKEQRILWYIFFCLVWLSVILLMIGSRQHYSMCNPLYIQHIHTLIYTKILWENQDRNNNHLEWGDCNIGAYKITTTTTTYNSR